MRLIMENKIREIWMYDLEMGAFITICVDMVQPEREENLV
jgi:hypothetical protein